MNLNTKYPSLSLVGKAKNYRHNQKDIKQVLSHKMIRLRLHHGNHNYSHAASIGGGE
jgi:hypothetical protein